MPQVTIDGLKTGTSDAAGACFVSTGTYQGHRFITVVLHANGDATNRFVQTQRLYQNLIDNVRTKQLKLTKAQTVNQVTGGAKRSVAVGPKKVTVWRTAGKTKLRVRLQYNQKLTNSSGHVKAPIKQHQKLGKIIVTGSKIKTVDNKPLTLPLRAQETVKRGNFWQRLLY